MDAFLYLDLMGEVSGDFVTTHVREAAGMGSAEKGPGINNRGFSGDNGSIPGLLRRSVKIFIPNPQSLTNI